MAKDRKIGNFIAGFILVGGLLCTAGTNAGKIVVENNMNDAKYFYNEYASDLSEIKGSFLDEEFYNLRQQELEKLEAQKEQMDAVKLAAKETYVKSDSFAYDYIKANNEEFYNETVKPLIEGSIRNYNKVEELNQKEDALSAVAASGLAVAAVASAAAVCLKQEEKEF